MKPDKNSYCRDNLLALLTAVIMICVGGCRTSKMEVGKVQLDFSKEQFPPRLTVVVSNGTSRVVKLWEQDNSWGWDNLVVDLKERNDERISTVRRRISDFTVNAPVFNTIAPGQIHRLEINLADGWWEIPQEVDVFNRSYQVRVRLCVASSREAEELGVFVGEIQSKWK